MCNVTLRGLIYIIKYDMEYMASHVWKQPYSSIYFKYRPYIYIYSYEATSTINPFKQPRRAFKLKMSNFKNFANCKIFVYLPDHNKQPAT